MRPHPNSANEEPKRSRLQPTSFVEYHKDVVRVLLNAGADPNIADDVGDTPLHVAAAYGHKMVVEMLLNAGADANMENNNRETPLYWAKRHSQKDAIKRLGGASESP